MKHYNVKLSDTEALVLQQVYENGEDTTGELAVVLGISRHRVIDIVLHLNYKGLVGINGDPSDIWVHVTKKGKEVMRYLWPEANGAFMAV